MQKRKPISFDWAIKRILKSKANFEILESKSNQELYDNKFNRLDAELKNLI